MLIYDDEYEWKGFGGLLKLAAGKCRLKIFDLRKGPKNGTAHLRPIIVIATDIPDSRISVRSVVSHIATVVTNQFSIDPQRMLFIEYYPEVIYGKNNENRIPEHYDAVEFTWHGDKAMHPKWRRLQAPMLGIVRELVDAPGETS